jgi:predicted amidophosphoribosyltransferase
MFTRFDVSFWIFLGVTLALLAWLILWVILDGNENDRQKRRLMGFCYRCGYDLRGGHDCCPECGHPVVRPKLHPSRD